MSSRVPHILLLHTLISSSLPPSLPWNGFERGFPLYFSLFHLCISIDLECRGVKGLVVSMLSLDGDLLGCHDHAVANHLRPVSLSHDDHSRVGSKLRKCVYRDRPIIFSDRRGCLLILLLHIPWGPPFLVFLARLMIPNVSSSLT